MTLAAVAVRATAATSTITTITTRATSTITTRFHKFTCQESSVRLKHMGKTRPLQIMPFNQRIKICVNQTQDGISGEEPGLGHSTGY